MRILIDLQGAQTTGSRHRGIGRYSLSLTEWIIRERGDHAVEILLNGASPDAIPDIRARLGGLLDDHCFHVFQPVGETRQAVLGNAPRRRASELIREAAIAALRPDIVHISSHFEGFGDEAITSIKQLDQQTIQSVTLYDLIPFIHQDTYLENANIRRWYAERLLQLRRADLLLGISESSSQEAVEYLGFPNEAVVNVGTAADPQFQAHKIPAARANELRARYGLAKRFVMYTGGIDYRKNIERLIGAFGSIGGARNDVSLAIVCSCNDYDRERLRTLCQELGLSERDVILTGFVPEEDLVDLYNMCELFVFPSWHEGFGLPALEAMHCGAPVIGSKRSSLPEVIGLPEALFDPFDESAIAAKIEQALTDRDFRARLLANSKKQAKAFSWKLSAQRAITAFEHAWRLKQGESEGQLRRRPRLAYVSPIRPANSGIADYSSELLPELSRHYAIDLVAPTRAQVDSADETLKNAYRIVDAASFLAAADSYDRVLYHFGNSDHHAHMVELIGRVPGVVVQHDFFLSGLMAWMEHAARLGPTFTQALFQSHGYAPLVDLARKVPLEEVMRRYPANGEVIERALGVIVHSNHSKRLAAEWLGPQATADWTTIPHLRVRVGAFDPAAARAKVDAGDRLLICSFGGLGETKQSLRLIDAFLNSNVGRAGQAKLVFIGAMPEDRYGEHLRQRLDQLGRPENIVITGRASTETYRDYLQAADIAVQLRTLSRGETSGAVLDCLNYGVPTILNANGSMADLPADAVVMLGDSFEDVELSRAIDRLASNEGQRARLRERGRATIRERHNPRRCADQYHSAIEHAYAQAIASPLIVAKAIAATAGELDAADQTEAAELIEPLFRRRIGSREFIDIGRVEGELSPAQLDDAIRSAAESLLDDRRPFEVVATGGSGRYETRRARALEAFGASDIALPECSGRLTSQDRVTVLSAGGAEIDDLRNLFVEVEIFSTRQSERSDAGVAAEVR